MKSIYKFYTALCCLALSLGTSMGAFAQADDCNLALGSMLTPGVAVTSTTVGSTFDNVGTCTTSNTSPGVWYTVIGTGGVLTLETCGGSTNYDTKISVFDGTAGCGALSCVTGNDDACGLQSAVTVNTNPGTIYYILIHGFSSATGTFTLSSSITQPTGNDVCAGAIPIACGDSASGSTVSATFDNVGTCGTSNTAPGVWHQFQATSTGTVIVSLCNGTTYDSKLSVFSGSCNALTCIDGNDDACGVQSEVSFSATAGQIYYILVHGFGSATGSYTLNISCPAPLANDDACGATPVTFGATTFSNFTATAQSGEVSPGSGTGISTCDSQDGWCSFELDVDNSVWFTFQAPASGCVSIVADGFDSQIALWDATDCNDFTTFLEIAANDDGGDNIIPTANSLSGGINEASCLIPGRTYYIQVDGYNGATTNSGTLTLIDCGGSLLAVDAGDCQSRYIGYAPSAADTNFLVATASGGQAPYTFTWTAVGDSVILFQVDGGATSTIAVQPGTNTTYTVTVTDNRGDCVSSDVVDVNVYDVSCGANGVSICCTPQSSGILLCDFDVDGFGNPLPAGREITNQYANRGIRISAINNSNGPDAAVIFNSSAPTGGDTDLGTPNMDFGGPGVGNGGRLGQPGANNVPLGKLLIVQENATPRNCGPGNNDFCVPDDEAGGGTLVFDFDCPTTIYDVVIVDADDGNPSGAVLTFNGGAASVNIPNLGNNSVQTVYVNQPGVTHMEVTFAGSGALASFHYKPDTSNICVDPNLVDVDSLLADPRYSLGPCGNTCTATNPSVPAPPACVNVVVNVLTDNFASETSWTLTDQTSNVVVAEVINGDYTSNTANSDTFCLDPTRCYTFTIDDSFGDGICCGFGNGTWSIDFNGTVTNSPSGGAFGVSETVIVGNCQGPIKGEASAPGSAMEDLGNSMEIMAYPNPTSGAATIKFRSGEDGPVKVEIFTMTGLRMATLFHGVVEAGVNQTVDFDTQGLPSGIYLYRITSENAQKVGKLQVAR